MVHSRFRAQILAGSSVSAIPGENGRIDQELAGLGPGSKGFLFPRPDDPIYREITLSAICGSDFRRELPRLIRSYCFMASSSDAFGCCDKCSFNRSQCLRWKSFR